MPNHSRRGVGGERTRVDGDRAASPDGGGKGSARREPAGSKNLVGSKPPRAGPEENRAEEEEEANSAPAAPTWRRPGSRRSAGRSPASPPLPLPCPGKGSAERRTERSCARGRCPSCGRRTSPPRAAPPSPGPPTRRWPERGWPQPWPAECSRSRLGPPARLLQPGRHERSPCGSSSPPAPAGAARPPGGASDRDRPAARRPPAGPGGAA